MSTRVTITGTGTPQLTPDRAGPGVHVRAGDVELQFDAGRSTVPRLVAIGSQPASLDAVFLTHYHSDHVLGLTDIVLSHWIMDRNDTNPYLDIVAPNGPTTRFVDRMLTIWDDDLAVRGEHTGRVAEPRRTGIGFDVGAAPGEVWRRGDVRVLAGQVRHEPVRGAVGYRIETPDGVVAITGDTRVCDEVGELARGADVLVYEAMRMDVIRALPPRGHFIMDYHADTRLIGAQAEQLGIPTLMLTHLIPVPSDRPGAAAFEHEVREGGYTGTVVVCNDLDAVDL